MKSSYPCNDSIVRVCAPQCSCVSQDNPLLGFLIWTEACQQHVVMNAVPQQVSADRHIKKCEGDPNQHKCTKSPGRAKIRGCGSHGCVSKLQYQISTPER